MTVNVAVALVQVDRDEVQVSMAYLGFGHERIGEVSYMLSIAPQDHGFQAVVVVQMHVHGGEHQVVMFVLQAGDAFGQSAGVMIVDIT